MLLKSSLSCFPLFLSSSFFLISLVIWLSFLVLLSLHHHWVFLLLLVLWKKFNMLVSVLHGTPTTGGSWPSQWGCYGGWSLPCMLCMVTEHAIDWTQFLRAGVPVLLKCRCIWNLHNLNIRSLLNQVGLNHKYGELISTDEYLYFLHLHIFWIILSLTAWWLGLLVTVSSDWNSVCWLMSDIELGPELGADDISGDVMVTAYYHMYRSWSSQKLHVIVAIFLIHSSLVFPEFFGIGVSYFSFLLM